MVVLTRCPVAKTRSYVTVIVLFPCIQQTVWMINLLCYPKTGKSMLCYSSRMLLCRQTCSLNSSIVLQNEQRDGVNGLKIVVTTKRSYQHKVMVMTKYAVLILPIEPPIFMFTLYCTSRGRLGGQRGTCLSLKRFQEKSENHHFLKFIHG